MLAMAVEMEEDLGALLSVAGGIVTRTAGHGETEIVTTIAMVAGWSSAGPISGNAYWRL
jgi:hypothetical protein